MDLKLQNSTAVVTGGSSGIGLATVRTFLAEGANVAFCARGAERLDTVRKELAREFGEKGLLAKALSVLDASAVNEFAHDVKARFGGCDALITNAGQARVSTFESTSDEEWRDELELKFFSQIYPIRAFQQMLRSAKSGTIVAVNSLLAYQPEPQMVCTSAARGGVQNLLKSLAREFAPEIRINAITVGLIDTAQTQNRFEARKDKQVSREAWTTNLAQEKQIPLERLGNPEEAAKVLVFLASPAASYITGAQLEISGGLSRFV